MSKLITILSTTNGHFAAEQHGQTFGFVAFSYAAVAIAVALVLVRGRSWKWGLVPAALLVIGLFLVFLNRGVLYRMEIVQSDSELHYSEIDKGKIVADSNIYLENISSADMQYRRQDARVVVVLRDGRQLYPLGDDWVRQDPDQAVVLAAIRNAISSPPSNSSRP